MKRRSRIREADSLVINYEIDSGLFYLDFGKKVPEEMIPSIYEVVVAVASKQNIKVRFLRYKKDSTSKLIVIFAAELSEEDLKALGAALESSPELADLVKKL